MSKTMTRLYDVDVFTSLPGQGNPTGVVLDSTGLSTGRMQEIAAQNSLEMAFVLPPTNPEATFRLRYFSPNSEMNLCGHATVGTLWVMATEGQLKGDCVIETVAGNLSARAEFENGALVRVLVQQPNQTYDEGPFPVELAASAISLAPKQISGPLVAALGGRSKLLIPLPDYATLDACERNETALEEICTTYNLTGLYPYTCRPRNPVTAEARQFPFNIGFVEDPVTGVAMAALGGYLVKNGLVRQTPPETRLVIEQGHALGCPGQAEVFVRVQNERITRLLLGGVAVIVGESEI